ncbi:MAG: valine--tRNA ligase [Methanocalculus sp. MSAO_Arc1]|uniref:valine--tRNA ligase n=1 Tax=Methanocalculus TaxID=71151 RepID=UPI000FF7D359|nr:MULTISPECIES: valine--tRNA ligase [unclassified Methanocalculus]MCP1663142.1 valyl-tRNA synthetase [Methanocalculus sp. AMF5]RQD79351.1 MAG: valine--tRNA ligase [Methanocalculus sp. MSAO_Arc1]
MSSPEDLQKTYDYTEVERRWLDLWQDEDFYFDWNSDKPRYIIDTPPPYPTGRLHIGHALNWVYMDIVARYKRMRGYNVMFPQGWDCHGLPTEVKVEEIHGITKNDVPRDEFREMCRALTRENIETMRNSIRVMGFSVDWSSEYITMDESYYRLTQESFLRMLENGYIYQSEHPVNFCTRCETAIAFAEVAYSDNVTRLNYFDFDGLEIATTRPELLAACVAVAVHPDDTRYRDLVGNHLTVPIFTYPVPVVADEAVDPAFGSGAVMICTFGDRQDVVWWKTHNLDLRPAIDQQGVMTSICGSYAGMTASECRNAILSAMKDQGILIRQEELPQRVGTCWRCGTPIEILSARQWFVKVQADEITRSAREITWYPEHMLTRLLNWTQQMEWDWCISRQRLFATPIPVWFCLDCGQMVLPDAQDLPIDPTIDSPKNPCAECGSTSFKGETDVLDTWMDSSISPLAVCRWDGRKTPDTYPTQLRPQGHDIIRTWAFYTILRSVALTGKKPWDAIMINGMVLGEDGFKMSKSRNNVITPDELIDRHGVDALRQWAAAGGATGSDITFSWNDVVAASRFQTKMWNIVRFSLLQIRKDDTHPADAPSELADRWLLSRLSETLAEVTDALDNYQYDRGLRAIRDFAWSSLADNYLELVKGRLYSDLPSRGGAVYTLRLTLDALCRMIAPYTPFFASECYHHLTGNRVIDQSWPEIPLDDATSLQDGDLLVSIVSLLRKYKHDAGLALNAPLGHVTVYTPGRSINDGGDAGRTTNAEIDWRSTEPRLDRVLSDVTFNMGIIGPAFRKDAGAVMAAIRSLPPETLEAGVSSVEIAGSPREIPEGAYTPVFSYAIEGEEVDLLTIPDVVLAIRRRA